MHIFKTKSLLNNSAVLVKTIIAEAIDVYEQGQVRLEYLLKSYLSEIVGSESQSTLLFILLRVAN
jgi:hypothetical protein